MMNRREALAALVAMPEVARIRSVPEARKDVLVVECTEYLSEPAVARIIEQFKVVWPDRQIVVLDRGLRLRLAPSDR